MISVLAIGHFDEKLVRPEPKRAQVVHAGTLSEAPRLLLLWEGPPPELILLAEPRPGAVSETSLRALRKLAPLARIWRLLGSWCEGETRSGRPPSGCLASYWHQWEARFAAELDALESGRQPPWSLPLTATADERIIAATQNCYCSTTERTGAVAVCADSATAAWSLADVLAAGGYEPLVLQRASRRRDRGIQAIVWDTTVEQLAMPARVERLREVAGTAPVVAVAGFPRQQDVDAARRAGVAAVVSKPLLACDLLWHVDRAACSA